jgi:hypothetical protein
MKLYKLLATLTVTELHFLIQELEVDDEVIYFTGTDGTADIKIRKIDLMITKEQSNIDPPAERWMFSIYCEPGFINEAKQSIINHISNSINQFELILKAKRKASKNTITNYKN